MLPAYADFIEGAEGAAFTSQDDTPAKQRESFVRWRTLGGDGGAGKGCAWPQRNRRKLALGPGPGIAGLVGDLFCPDFSHLPCVTFSPPTIRTSGARGRSPRRAGMKG
jgi:hypothetical protein